MLAYYDAIQYSKAFFGGGNDQAARDDTFWAIEEAINDVVFNHGRQWHSLRKYEIINTVAAYTTGTITYTHTGGAYERVVTLAGGTWPTSAARGWVRISSANYEIEDRKSTTQATLTEANNPGANVASGTSYTWFQDTYSLSDTFQVEISAPEDANGYQLCPASLENWNSMRHATFSTGTPTQYAIGDDPKGYAKAIQLWPAPSTAARLLLFGYHAPKQALATGLDSADSQGTITVAAAATAVTGNSSAFDTTLHKGALLRVGRDGNTAPIGFHANVRPLCDRQIADVTSTTAMILTAALPKAVTAVKYLISDPIDLHKSLHNLFWATLDLKLAERTRRGWDEIKKYDWSYKRTAHAAYEADTSIREEFIMQPPGVYVATDQQSVVVLTGN